MFLLKKFFRLQDDTPGASGSTPVDRGDTLEPLEDTSAADAAAAKNVLKADPVVKLLEEELEPNTEADAPAEDKKKDSRIPLSRHEAVLSKEREKRAALEAQLAQYQQGSQLQAMNVDLTAAENKIVALEKEYATLLTDGEIDKATATMREIRRLDREITEANGDMKIQAATARATESARYNTALDRIEGAFPVLNPDHEDYDRDTENEVSDLAAAYQTRGMTPTAALQKAVKLIVGVEGSRQEAATSVKPQVDAKDVAAERKRDAATAAAKAIGKTPANMERAGVNSDKLGGGALSAEAVMRMSQKEFAGLSDSDLSKMRGDTL